MEGQVQVDQENKRAVRCPQCQGLVVYEIILAEGKWVPQTRCVNCGWIYQRPDPGSEFIFRTRKRRTYKRKGGWW